MARWLTYLACFHVSLAMALATVAVLALPEYAYADPDCTQYPSNGSCAPCQNHPSGSQERSDCAITCCGGAVSESNCWSNCCEDACGNDQTCLAKCTAPCSKCMVYETNSDPWKQCMNDCLQKAETPAGCAGPAPCDSTCSAFKVPCPGTWKLLCDKNPAPPLPKNACHGCQCCDSPIVTETTCFCRLKGTLKCP